MTKARNFKPNNSYHIYNRGNKKEKIFITEDDYEFFEETLKYAAGKFGIWIYAWCLMDNHFHLLVRIKDPEELPLLMHKITTSYSWYMRTKYKMVGHIFQGRYCSKEIYDKNHFQKVLSYIKNNPVKKKYCVQNKYYRWLKVLDNEYQPRG